MPLRVRENLHRRQITHKEDGRLPRCEHSRKSDFTFDVGC